MTKITSRRWVIASIILTAIVLLWLIIGNFFYSVVMHFDTRKGERGLDYQIEQKRFDAARYDTLHTKEFFVDSDFGYKLSALYIENYTKSDTVVVVVHGLSGNKFMMLPFADMYIDMGYNVLLYDHPNHGESGGKAVKYGHAEKYDLSTMIRSILDEQANAKLILHGESLGAATVLLYSGLSSVPDAVCGYIADSPYSDMVKQLKIRLKDDYGLPNLFFIETMNLFARIKARFSVYSVKPIESVKNTRKPILFIHGNRDDYVPTFMSEKMYPIAPTGSQIWISDNHGHAKSFFEQRETYIATVKKFIANL